MHVRSCSGCLREGCDPTRSFGAAPHVWISWLSVKKLLLTPRLHQRASWLHLTVRATFWTKMHEPPSSAPELASFPRFFHFNYAFEDTGMFYSDTVSQRAALVLFWLERWRFWKNFVFWGQRVKLVELQEEKAAKLGTAVWDITWCFKVDFGTILTVFVATILEIRRHIEPC